jgi:site-specific DNA recombinase
MVVWRVLRHEIYAGRLAHYRVTRKGKQGKREQRSKDEWVYVQVPAIIDEDTFQAVQQRIEQAQQRSRRNSKHFYLLGRGRLRCACGYAMNGTTSSAGKAGKPARRYYRCRANAADAVTPCALPRVNAEHIEQAVWAWLESTLTPESIERGILYEQQTAHTHQPDIAAEMERLTQRRAELTHEHERMIQAYKAGILSMEELARDKQQHDAALARIDAELAHLAQQQQAPNFDSEALTTVARQLQHELPHLSAAEKLHLLELLQVQVVRAADEQGQQWAHVSCKIDAARLSVDGVLCHTPQPVTRCPLPG